MTRKEKVKIVIDGLNTHYSHETKCYLDHETPYELLFATILSAQCTDDRVNIVTKDLFKKYPSLSAFANASIEELENDVKTTGFYRNKAKGIHLSAVKLLTEFGGEMPSDIDILTTFPGVGRKTANVVRGHIFNLPSLVVDTHVKRISNKLGLTKEVSPEKIEFDLMKIIPKDYWIEYNTKVIAHGRSICTAKKPKCEICFFTNICTAYK